jgi:hypothetical protein
VDGVGNITQITDGSTPRTYSYIDNLYFLKQGDGPWGTRGWTYDRIGNRLTETRGTTTDNAQVDPVEAPAGFHPYIYTKAQPLRFSDPDGRLPVFPATTPCALKYGSKAKERGKVLGWRWAHCWASCEISKNCYGEGVAGLFGFAKEISDSVKCLIDATTHTFGFGDACWSAFQASDFRDNKFGFTCPSGTSCDERCEIFMNADETQPGPLYGLFILH